MPISIGASAVAGDVAIAAGVVGDDVVVAVGRVVVGEEVEDTVEADSDIEDAAEVKDKTSESVPTESDEKEVSGVGAGSLEALTSISEMKVGVDAKS